MPQSDTAPPLSFPEPALTIPYPECLRYAQYRLKSLGHGDLKPFCKDHKLPYTTVVNLKNGTLKREEHRLMRRLLTALNFKTKLYRVPLETDQKEQHAFLFPNRKELETFQGQLKYYDGLAAQRPPQQDE